MLFFFSSLQDHRQDVQSEYFLLQTWTTRLTCYWLLQILLKIWRKSAWIKSFSDNKNTIQGKRLHNELFCKSHSYPLCTELIWANGSYYMSLGLASSLLLLPAPTNPRNARIRRGDPLAKTPKPNVKRGERRTVAQKRKFRRVHGLLRGLNCWPGNVPSWLYISCKASCKKEKMDENIILCSY